MTRDAAPREGLSNDTAKRARAPHPERGFTLTEIMIAVAIVGILAAIALPSYARHVEKARRTDATAFLSEVAGEQVRFFSENNAYAATMGELGYGTKASHPTPEGHYTVSVVSVGTRRFTLTATADPDGPQARDTDCAAISITSTGARTPSGAGGGADCW